MERNYKIWIGIIILIFISILTLAYWFLGSINSGCLDKVAKDYCKDLNMNYLVGSGLGFGFSCYDINERTNRHEKFNFLKSEKEKCCDKKRKTFKWGCD